MSRADSDRLFEINSLTNLKENDFKDALVGVAWFLSASLLEIRPEIIRNKRYAPTGPEVKWAPMITNSGHKNQISKSCS